MADLLTWLLGCELFLWFFSYSTDFIKISCEKTILLGEEGALCHEGTETEIQGKGLGPPLLFSAPPGRAACLGPSEEGLSWKVLCGPLCMGSRTSPCDT